MFDGFKLEHIDTGEATLRVQHGGNGPPILLLHGHPQTHVCWHLVAPQLAEHFTVVCPDLRGYGESSKPPTTPDHEPYSKRAMARDMVALMRGLGHERFAVAGHDRGGRVAYRLALDHPGRVSESAVLDIIPTVEIWRRLDRALGLDYWHWLFLAQPHPLPEDLLAANPDAYYFRGGREQFEPDAFADYLRAVHDSATVHAMCEDYRAGATYDAELDENDRGKKAILCPVLALWSSQSTLWQRLDVLEIWRDWADDVRGRSLECGHYLPEEKPDEVAAELDAFLSGEV